MKKLLVAFLLTNSILFAFTDEERRFWERVNPEQLKKWEKVRSQMGSSVNEDQKSKQKEDNENEIVGYTQNNLPITKADMKWRVTMNSLSASNSKEWGKVVTMPDNCKSGLDNKLYDIMTISTNVLNQHPKDWLNGKYLEFVNSKCSLVGTYTLRDTTKEDFDKLVNKNFPSKEEILERKAFYEQEMKQENNFNTIFGVILLILILGWFIRNDKPKPISILEKKKPSRFWRFFWWWAIWDSTNK